MLDIYTENANETRANHRRSYGFYRTFSPKAQHRQKPEQHIQQFNGNVTKGYTLTATATPAANQEIRYKRNIVVPFQTIPTACTVRRRYNKTHFFWQSVYDNVQKAADTKTEQPCQYVNANKIKAHLSLLRKNQIKTHRSC